jgi:RNA polymerase sigma-70 factor (ECF subfamily)
MANKPAQFASEGVASDDLDLVHATLRGDVYAFEELVRRYDRKLLRIALNVTHNAEDAQDAVQEAFFKAFQKLGEFRAESQFSTWLIRIALNQAIMKVRKRCSTKELSLDGDFQVDGATFPIDLTDWAPNPEQRYRTSELREILRKALQELPPMSRTVFVLRDIEGFSIEETAVAMNLTHATVKSRLLRGRLQLRESLARYFRKQTRPLPTQSVPFGKRAGSTLDPSFHMSGVLDTSDMLD